jgi:hypothetical protein
MKINLKDLVWKEIDEIQELNKLVKKYNSDKFSHITPFGILNEHAEQFIKEKNDIENKKIEYIKDDIIEMFVNAGFETNIDSNIDFDLIYTLDIGKSDDYNIAISIYDYHIRFDFWFDDIDNALMTPLLNFNDRKSIEFYYNKLREIFEFEVNNAV